MRFREKKCILFSRFSLLTNQRLLLLSQSLFSILLIEFDEAVVVIETVNVVGFVAVDVVDSLP